MAKPAVSLFTAPLPGTWRANVRFEARSLPRAITALSLLAAPLHAQMPGVQASTRVGIAIPSDNYQSSCGDASLAFSLDVQGRQRWFPQLSLDYFSGGGGGDVACIPVAPSVGTGVGGLRLDGATRLGLGAGARVRRRVVQLEGVLLGGIVGGRRGFEGSEMNDQRRVMPHIGGQATIVLFRYAVLSAATHWTRLSLDVLPAGGGASTKRTTWSPLTTLQVGVRVPFGQP